MRLTDGDALSVQGALKAETYEKDGATKLSLSVVADHVLALRQAPKPREKTSPSERPAGANRDFDDAIPY
jgi:single-stranded DNA-binding protein